MIRTTAILLLMAGMGGCAGGIREDLPPMMSSRQKKEPVLLTVQNDRFEDAGIYAIWQGGSQRRVGTVTGKSSQTFSFDWVADVIRIRIDFVAAEDYTVEPISVAPGDHLNLQITP